MEGQLTERDLVIRFRDAKTKRDEARDVLEKANKEYETAESQLAEALAAQGKKTTAKYEGIGHVTLVKPRLYASCQKENEDQLFAFLREAERGDLIKEAVHSGSLSSFVGQMIEEGQAVPEYINYYLKTSLRLTASQ